MPRPVRRLWRTSRCLSNWRYIILLLLLVFLVIVLQMNAHLNWGEDGRRDYKPSKLIDVDIPVPVEENSKDVEDGGIDLMAKREEVRPLPVQQQQPEDHIDVADDERRRGNEKQADIKQPQAPVPNLVKLPTAISRKKGHRRPSSNLAQPLSRSKSANFQPQGKAPPTTAQGLAGSKQIYGVDYPILTTDGNFIPIRRWVHLDLKGGAYKPPYFFQLFAFFKKISANGVVIEWEDMFPFEGKLAAARNGDAYTMEEVEAILLAAKEMKLEVVPLVQTFGHLEWVLKLKEFAHLREDPRLLNVICFGSDESWALLEDMIDQVAKVHQKHSGMRFFHMGSDEVFQVGVCNESLRAMDREGGRERAMLWHISRTAKHIRESYGVTVLAWHDMFVHSQEEDLKDYGMYTALEPVLWSYAEDLDQYLPRSDWWALKPFKNVWGASAFKGADHPNRFDSNPIHYIRNHESWTVQMTRVYKDFDYIQGLIMSGWSRYDHMAIMCELMPVGIPSLVMSMETILAGRALSGRYEKSQEVLHCNAPFNPGYVVGCQFPGAKIYELVNEYGRLKEQIQRYMGENHELTGWVSNVAVRYNFSSPLYAEKVLPFLDYNLIPLERIEKDLRLEMAKIYSNETVDEYILTYMSDDLRLLRSKYDSVVGIVQAKKLVYPRRPFISYPTEVKPRPTGVPSAFGGPFYGNNAVQFVQP